MHPPPSPPWMFLPPGMPFPALTSGSLFPATLDSTSWESSEQFWSATWGLGFRSEHQHGSVTASSDCRRVGLWNRHRSRGLPPISPASRPGPSHPSHQGGQLPGLPETGARGHPREVMLLDPTAGIVTWSAPGAAGLLLQTHLWLLSLSLLEVSRGCGRQRRRWGQGSNFCRKENMIRPLQAAPLCGQEGH